MAPKQFFGKEYSRGILAVDEREARPWNQGRRSAEEAGDEDGETTEEHA